MQGSLIAHRTGEQRLAIVFPGDRQARKPVRPLAAQMALDPDLIDRGLRFFTFQVVFVCHAPVPPVTGQNPRCLMLHGPVASLLSRSIPALREEPRDTKGVFGVWLYVLCRRNGAI